MKLQKHDNKGPQDSIKKPTNYQILVAKLKIALAIILGLGLLLLIAKMSDGFAGGDSWGWSLLIWGLFLIVYAMIFLFMPKDNSSYSHPNDGISKFIADYLVEKQKKALRKKAVLQAEEKPEVNITKAEPHQRDIKDADSDDEWSNF